MSRINVANFRHPDGTSDNINLDSSGNVGVGASTPSDFNDGGTGGKNLVIEASGAGRGVLTFAAEQTGGADEPLGIVNFVDSDTTNTSKRGARILGLRGSDANSAYMRFETANSGAPAEVGRFTHDGEFRFNSGYGSVATAYGCRAWVNFTGTGTVAIRDSGNVSSITDRGTGQYTVNFTNAMPDINYCAVPSGNPTYGGAYNSSVIIDGPGGTTGTTTSACQIHVRFSTGSSGDADTVTLAVFR